MRFGNVLIESYSIIISFVLAFYLYFHRKSMRRQKNWFVVMLSSNIVMSICDMADWLLSGNPSSYAPVILNVGMVMYFASSGVLLASYTFYLLAYLDLPIRNKAGVISGIFGIVQIVLSLLSPFAGGMLFFYIGADHVYHRGELFLLSQVTAGIVYIVQMFLLIKWRRKLQRKDVIFLSSYIIIPIVAELLQVIFYEMALINVGATIAMLLVFINVQSMQSLRIERAEAAAKAKTDFLANMSHEIRTPINAVLGMNEIIIRESTESNILEYAAIIKSAGKKLLAIINDILDFSKIESRKMEIIPVPYSLSSLIHDLYAMVAERAEKKGLSLNLKVSPDVPENLLGDEVRINQIALNLLTNSVKYTNKGFIEFKIGYIPRETDILLQISVKDSGIGIRKEEMEHLFDTFRRVDEKRNRSIEGSGLGLSIVKQLVGLMEGEISVHSVYGEGSEFSVAIPQKVVSEEPIGDYAKRIIVPAQEEERKQTYFVAPEAKILAVDDNEMNLKVLKGLLKPTRIQLDMAGNGEAAIEKTVKTTYDMILLDHRMPQMDGIETLQIMRERELLHGTPVIALTANAISGAREMYIQNGFQDYLSKPISTKEMDKLLRRWLPEEKLTEYTEEDIPSEKKTEMRIQKLRSLLDIDRAMEYAGDDAEGLVMNLTFFCENAPILDKSLCEEYQKKDFENYSIHAHALKNNAATIGAVGLSKLAKQMEYAGKELQSDKIEENHLILIESYRSMVNCLERYLSD